jgi:DNA processing protein
MTTSLAIADIILLSKVSGIGNQRLRQLVPKIGTLNDLHQFTLYDWNKLRGLNPTLMLEDLKVKQHDQKLLKQIERSIEFSDQVISFWDEQYPKLLKEIYNPPPFLFCKGNGGLLNKQTVGVVGSRRMTAYGKEVTTTIARELSENNLCIVSGFAQGVDTIAHHEASLQNGKTIAVLGSGINRIYPKSNAQLYQQLLEKECLIVSEFLIDTKPDAMNFPKRNRIIAGLCKALIVTEAHEKSGALITAEFTIEHNRDLFAVPGPITSQASAGCNQLIKQGATPYLNCADFFDHQRVVRLNNQTRSTQLTLFKLSRIEEKIMNEIKGRIHIDELSLKLNMPIQELSAHLLNLEMNQCVKQERGQYYQQIKD